MDGWIDTEQCPQVGRLLVGKWEGRKEGNLRRKEDSVRVYVSPRIYIIYHVVVVSIIY